MSPACLVIPPLIEHDQEIDEMATFHPTSTTWTYGQPAQTTGYITTGTGTWTMPLNQQRWYINPEPRRFRGGRSFAEPSWFSC